MLRRTLVLSTPKEGANMALADRISTMISTSFETESQQATELDYKLKDSERKFVTVKRKKEEKAGEGKSM